MRFTVLTATLITFTCLTNGLVLAENDKTPNASVPNNHIPSNPVPFNMNNVKRGKQLYASHCQLCHGADGKGDTQMREFLKTHPANLTDEQWIYGNRDGDIFDVIKTGRTNRDMPAFGDTLTDERVWQVIHYIRYMGEKDQ